MAKITRKQIGLIHVAKAKVNITEDDYRALLSSFGVSSSKDLERSQFKEILAAFEKLGFENKSKPQLTGTRRQPRSATGSPHTFITDKQRGKMLAIWNEVSRAEHDKKLQALNTFCKKITNVDSINWLSVGQAQKLIVALEKMQISKQQEANADRSTDIIPG